MEGHIMAKKYLAALAGAVLTISSGCYSEQHYSAQTPYGKLTTAYQDCIKRNSTAMCVSYSEPKPFKEFVASHIDFEWFKRANKLPTSTTRNSIAKTSTLYVLDVDVTR